MSEARARGCSMEPNQWPTRIDTLIGCAQALTAECGMTGAECRGSSTASAAVGKTAAGSAPAAPPAKRARPAASAAAAAEPAGPADDDDSALSMGSLSREEAEGRLGELFGEGAVVALRSDKWKERLEAMDTILAKVGMLLKSLSGSR